MQASRAAKEEEVCRTWGIAPLGSSPWGPSSSIVGTEEVRWAGEGDHGLRFP